jgi:hypothetical protein
MWACNNPRWRLVLLVLFTTIVLLAALVLLVIGTAARAGMLHEAAVLLLLAFALLGSLVAALLAYGLFRRWCAMRGTGPKGPGTRERSGPGKATLPPAIRKRPDPMIYSQYFLMAQGFAVTWENPDIWVTELPAPDGSMAVVPPHALLPGHTYRVHVRVHNNSVDAPAVGMPVVFSYLSFGVGTVSTVIGATAVTLPVKGAVGHPATTFHDWKTPTTPGHYCIQVLLIWDDDKEKGNNFGQHNVDVKTFASPATFTFSVRNDALMRRLFALEADFYQPPVADACPVPLNRLQGSRTPRTRPDASALLARHRRRTHPLPPGWTVTFTPGPEFVLAAGASADVTAVVTAPLPQPRRRAVNVHAFADGVLAGGVTLFVQS